MRLKCALQSFSVRVNLGIWRLRQHKWRGCDADTKTMKIDAQSMEERQRVSRRAVRSLERHMKRANRALRASLTSEQYVVLLEDWKLHLRWMRLHLVYFKPARPVLKGRKTRQQQTLKILMEMAARGLRNERYQPPDDTELRRVIRLYARSARRAREGITVKDMIDDPKSFSKKRIWLCLS